jgi:hypothetical protein
MDRVTEEMCATDKFATRTLQLYCLKVLMINKYSMSITQFKHYINKSPMPKRFTWMHNNELLRMEAEENLPSNIDLLPS